MRGTKTKVSRTYWVRQNGFLPYGGAKEGESNVVIIGPYKKQKEIYGSMKKGLSSASIHGRHCVREEFQNLASAH